MESAGKSLKFKLDLQFIVLKSQDYNLIALVKLLLIDLLVEQLNNAVIFTRLSLILTVAC